MFLVLKKLSHSKLVLKKSTKRSLHSDPHCIIFLVEVFCIVVFANLHYLGMFLQMIASLKTVPPRMFLIVPLGDFHIFFSLNSSTLASSGVMVAHLMPTWYFRTALAQSTVTWKYRQYRDYLFKNQEDCFGALLKWVNSPYSRRLIRRFAGMGILKILNIYNMLLCTHL